MRILPRNHTIDRLCLRIIAGLFLFLPQILFSQISSPTMPCEAIWKPPFEHQFQTYPVAGINFSEEIRPLNLSEVENCCGKKIFPAMQQRASNGALSPGGKVFGLIADSTGATIFICSGESDMDLGNEFEWIGCLEKLRFTPGQQRERVWFFFRIRNPDQ